MNDKRTHARAWLRKAESDLVAARRLMDAEGPYDIVCFHAQQAVEKSLKALLASTDVSLPRTHNLEDLQALCLALPVPPPSALGGLDLSELTPFAVESRYDVEFWPDRETARRAVALASTVWTLASGTI